MSKNLLGKWLPRKNLIINNKNFTSDLQEYLKLSPKKYRKLIVKLSNTVEQKMCAKQWSKINYEHVPSKAFNKYRDAFKKNDEKRFSAFLGEVESGEKKINASAIYPYDMYRSWKTGADKRSIDAQWASLPNYLEGRNERILPICDVSGSMSGTPMEISVSIGVYLSERNESIFKDAFVTFSGRPTMEYLSGSVTQRFSQLERAHWDMNTNLDAVFELLLTKAVKEKIKASEMPTTLLIISDMEFDSCATLTNYENIVAKYKIAGYTVPKIVFWNVNGREGNVPVNSKQKNVALVSGASPSIVKSVLSGKNFTPTDIMLETINTKRYSVLKV